MGNPVSIDLATPKTVPRETPSRVQLCQFIFGIVATNQSALDQLFSQSERQNRQIRVLQTEMQNNQSAMSTLSRELQAHSAQTSQLSNDIRALQARIAEHTQNVETYVSDQAHVQTEKIKKLAASITICAATASLVGLGAWYLSRRKPRKSL